jgi:ATP-dependent protease ClpP protease subunit
LASGTKGTRRIGANCRLMLHSVSAGHHGSIFSLENEFDEFKWVQEKYFDALAAESKLKPRQIKKILDQKMNVYFDAQQALKYGIVDEII